MENHYICANLFILFQGEFDILCSGTTQVNHRGWPQDAMTLTKLTVRVDSLLIDVDTV
jgi:hypothetical protein